MRRDIEDKAIATRQAEVSFKAGKETGIREVVEFIKMCFPMTINTSVLWKSKLKEWGVEK